MKKTFSSAIILFFLMLNLSAQQKSYRDIWIFASDAGNASFITQKSTLANAPDLKERDLQVHEIVGLKGNENQFKKYKVPAQGFTFILIGKDGGEKMRSHEPVSLEKLYRTIDAMPMRQQEMKQRKP